MRTYILASILVLTACGGGGDDVITGENVPPDQIAEELGPATCSKMFECCTTEELMDQLLGAETEAECEEFYLAFIGSLFEPVLQDSIEAGRVVYHGEIIGGCIDAYEALSCEEFGDVLSGNGPFMGCGDPFEATVELGGECANDFDCLSSFCPDSSIDLETMEITYGVCTELPAIGEACIDDDCGEDAYCDSNQATPTCAAKLADGSECTFDDDCESDFCSDANLCAVNVTCDGV